jgi:hypothetical protein
MPLAMVFHVKNGLTLGPKVGSLAKQILFPDYSDFLVRVQFSIARPDYTLTSSYAHHAHPLFNSFVGIYEVEVPFSTGHAFAFDEDGKPVIEDILKLALADWGLFSAHMYGAPEEAILKQLKKPLSISNLKSSEFYSKHDNRGWTFLKFKTVVPTPLTGLGEYPSHKSLLFPAWRMVFGRRPRKAMKVDNMPVNATGYIRYEKHRKFYRTIVVGIAINEATFSDYPKLSQQVEHICREIIDSQ